MNNFSNMLGQNTCTLGNTGIDITTILQNREGNLNNGQQNNLPGPGLIQEINSAKNEVNNLSSSSNKLPPFTEEQLQSLAHALGLKSSADLEGIDMNALAAALQQQMPNGPPGSTAADLKLKGGKKLGENGLEDQVKGIYITPEPGFVFKTKRAAPEENNKKVFVNMCKHDSIDAPGLKKRLNEEGESVEGMNVPMSVGPARIDKDNKGVDCIVYDIIVNPSVIEEAKTDPTGKYRDFICQLGIQCLEQKYKEVIDNRYKLPKLASMGILVAQYIKDKKNIPKIEEVSETKTPKTKITKRENKYEDIVALDIELPFKLVTINKKEGNDNDIELSIHNVINGANFNESPLLLNAGEYVEPIKSIEDNNVGIHFIAEINNQSAFPKDIVVQASPYKLQVKIPSYKQVSIYLPSAIMPSTITSSLFRRDGIVSKVEFHVLLQLDRLQWNENPDAGSKAWLGAQALSGNEGYDIKKKSDSDIIDNTSESSNATSLSNKVGEEILPEEKFHLKFPKNVDQYTGVVLDDEEEKELPEDRFHKKDASSQYLINQRDQAVKDKWDKHAKEKQERVDDPNVEYIDVHDFKSGGKYGPKKTLLEGEIDERSEFQKASDIIASQIRIEGSLDGLDLSSMEWTELL